VCGGMGGGVEELRELFRPSRVVVLLVGESPPAGGSFFYSPGGSRLGWATMEAFEEAFEVRFSSYSCFLEFFRSRGFYLVDLLDERGRRVDEASEGELAAAVRRLAGLVGELRPRLVVAVLCRVCGCVEEAVRLAGSGVPVVCLPFPARSRSRYVSGLAEVLRALEGGSPVAGRSFCSGGGRPSGPGGASLRAPWALLSGSRGCRSACRRRLSPVP